MDVWREVHADKSYCYMKLPLSQIKAGKINQNVIYDKLLLSPSCCCKLLYKIVKGSMRGRIKHMGFIY